MKLIRIICFLALGCIHEAVFSQAPEITELVYYIDADPGDGSRTAIAITANDTIEVSASIPTTGLNEGFHTLSILAKDENNVWGLVERKPFYVNQSVTAAQNSLTAMEYFIDSDPSQGSATAITVSANTGLDFPESIPTSGLAEGFHTIGFRAQDENGIWGLVEQKPFTVVQSNSSAQNNLVEMEYFIDADPGRGLGTPISIAAGTDFNFVESIPTAGLTQGFHSLSVRARDENGIWGLAETKAFYVNLSITAEQNIIQNIEYFIDSDPGHGNATPVTFTENTNLNIIANIPTASLTPGFHVFTIRAQDENGVWGLVDSKPFFIGLSTSSTQNLMTRFEYFFDADPGIGNGTAIDISDTVAINFLDSIPTTGLPVGFHTFSIRAEDEYGVWGLVDQKPFYVDPARNITLVEYALGTDPGVGNATQAVIDPAVRNPEVSLSIPSDGFVVGSYQFYARALDSNMQWSLTDSITVTFCDGAIANFDVGPACVGAVTEFNDLTVNSDPNDMYSWDFTTDDEIDDTTVGNSGFTYLTSGTYLATLTVDRSGCISSHSMEITVNELPIILANSSLSEICAGEEIILTGSGGETYVWDNGVEDNVGFAPAETTTYTVTGTDTNGCANSATVEVIVKTVDQPTVSLVSDNGRQIELTASTASAYQWYESGDVLTGETNQSINVERTYTFGGNYSVEVFEDGCSNISEEFVIAILELLDDTSAELLIWPNPVNELLNVGADELGNQEFSYFIANNKGQKMLSGRMDQNSEISVESLSPGIYFLVLNQDQRVLVNKFIKN